MTKAIVRAGLGIGALENDFGAPGDDKIVVQTGLPERYLTGDTPMIKDVLEGTHNFALRVGKGEWKLFRDFTININDIGVMSQPKGTLFSVCIEKNGEFHPDAQKYLTSSIIVFDPGFGTLDLFPIRAGVVGKGETNDRLGMMRVFQETSKLIKENFSVDVPVPEMQKYLNTGKVRYSDRKTFKSKDYEFDKLLAMANNKICDEAIAWLTSVVTLTDYNYMIITGGTGAAWDYKIREKFKDFTTLQLIAGNQNDELPLIYSNVRGYYLWRFNKLGRTNS